MANFDYARSVMASQYRSSYPASGTLGRRLDETWPASAHSIPDGRELPSRRSKSRSSDSGLDQSMSWVAGVGGSVAFLTAGYLGIAASIEPVLALAIALGGLALAGLGLLNPWLSSQWRRSDLVIGRGC